MAHEGFLYKLATTSRALNALTNITLCILILATCILIHGEKFFLFLLFLIGVHGLFFLSILLLSLARRRILVFAILILGRLGLGLTIATIIFFILGTVVFV